MIHSYKKIVCAALVGASFVACSFQSFSVSAIDISVGEQAGISDYTQAGYDGLASIDLAWNKDEDGNQAAHLKIYGLQKLLFDDTFHIYDNMNFSAAPDTVTFSGSGRSGFYYLSGQYGVRRLCSITLLPEYSSSNFGQVFVNADDFTISVSAVTPSNGTMIVYNDNYDGRHPWDIKCNVRLTGDNVIDIVGTGLCTTYSNFMVLQNGSGNTSRGFSIIGDPNYIPTVSSWTFQYNPSPTLYGQPAQYTLPESSVDTDSPWNYYNNVLLPYIHEEFPTLEDIDQFLVFPDGYIPEEPTEPSTIPIEYPTAPTMDLGLIEEGTQPAGMETAAYELPEIETKSIGVPVFDLSAMDPAQIVSPVSNGLSGLWALISDLLNSFGLMPLVTLTLFVLVIGALLTLGR